MDFAAISPTSANRSHLYDNLRIGKPQDLVLTARYKDSYTSTGRLEEKLKTASGNNSQLIMAFLEKDTVFFSTSPLDDFELPKIDPPNATAGEQWEFDGISEDGMESFVFGFYRDPNYSFFGTGNLRMYAEFAFRDGSRYVRVDYAEDSVIETCPGRGTRGTWRDKDWRYTFEVSSDMSVTKILMDSPEGNATIHMTSVTPPRYADNSIWPSNNATLLTVPFFYWAEPVPVATVALSATIEGRNISWMGMGGHERIWGAFNWFTCLASLSAVRLMAGPWALSFIEFGSGLNKDLLVPSVMLTENGKVTFATRRTTPSDTEDYVQYRRLYNGDGITTNKLTDKAVGVEVILSSPSRMQTWDFTVRHKNIGFEYNLGEGCGGTAYSGSAWGGIVGGRNWQGPAFSEIMKFPKKSMLLAKNYVE
ncbi:hypothetical protein GGS24DRAFT_495459 [Hypoxylon argillaceum]|nr:hypothetical protein GGS24DRAFT_495459 [Hypoxylon argillaceum]